MLHCLEEGYILEIYKLVQFGYALHNPIEIYSQNSYHTINMSQHFNDSPQEKLYNAEAESAPELSLSPELQLEMERPVSPDEVGSLFRDCIDKLVNASTGTSQTA